MTIEQIEHALILLAYFIERDGDVHLPMFERLERELAEMRNRQSILDRAQKLRETYTIEGALKKTSGEA